MAVGEIENGVAAQKTTIPNLTTPVGAVLNEIREDLPLLDDMQDEQRERGGRRNSGGDAEDDDNEGDAEKQEALAEVAARRTHNKMSTFA